MSTGTPTNGNFTVISALNEVEAHYWTVVSTGQVVRRSPEGSIPFFRCMWKVVTGTGETLVRSPVPGPSPVSGRSRQTGARDDVAEKQRDGHGADPARDRRDRRRDLLGRIEIGVADEAAVLEPVD